MGHISIQTMLAKFIYSAKTITSSKKVESLLVAGKEVGLDKKKNVEKISICSQLVKGILNKFKVTIKINFVFMKKPKSRLYSENISQYSVNESLSSFCYTKM